MLALVVAGGAWLLGRDRAYVAPPPAHVERSARPGPASDVLDRLVTALRDRDAAAARSLAPAGDTAAADQLADLATNADALRLTDLAARYVGETGAVSSEGKWHADVELTWRVAGFDPRPVTSEVEVGFVPVGDAGAAISSVGGAVDGAEGGEGGRTPLWLVAPLQVRRTAQTLVAVDGDAAAADRFARLARRAVPTVRRVLPWPRPRLVVEVPSTTERMEQALGAAEGTYAGVAAVTASVDGSTRPGAPVHVVANPALFAGLDGAAAQLVVSHEATHVATGAATSGSMPMWLLEGFADYVALRDVDLPLSTTAGQVIAQVRRDGPPDHLPGPAEFDASSEGFGAAYEAAWVACRLLARLAGEDALVALHERVQGGEPLGQAMAVTGYDLAGFTARWQQELEKMAR